MNAVVSTGGGEHRSVASWWRGRYGFRMLHRDRAVRRAADHLPGDPHAQQDRHAGRVHQRPQRDAVRELARPAVRGQSPVVAARSPDVDQAAQPLLHLLPLPGCDRLPALAVPAATAALRPVPQPDGVRHVRGADHPPAVPAGAAADDDRLRRHDARVRSEHLPEERDRRRRQPDRGDAVAALRLGDDRSDRRDQHPEVEVALADRAPSAPDGDVDHRHRQPLVARCRSRGDHHHRLRRRSTACSSCGPATGTGRGRRCASRPTRDWQQLEAVWRTAAPTRRRQTRGTPSNASTDANSSTGLRRSRVG